jgi:hypothetical protein
MLCKRAQQKKPVPLVQVRATPPMVERGGGQPRCMIGGINLGQLPR